MEAKPRKVVLFLIVYIFIFWIGFKSGQVYARMKNKSKFEEILLPAQAQIPNRNFYIVEEYSNGTHDFVEADENNVLMKLYFNEKLRPLLKLRNIKIYNGKGDKIY